MSLLPQMYSLVRLIVLLLLARVAADGVVEPAVSIRKIRIILIII